MYEEDDLGIKRIKLEPAGETEVKEEPGVKSEPMETEENRHLTNYLTADKIQQLKLKKQLNRKKRIATSCERTADDCDDLQYHARSGESTLKVRTYLTRDNCMDSALKDFRNVFDLLKSVQIQEKREKDALRCSPDLPKSIFHQPVVPTPKPAADNRYDRYGQETYLDEDFGAMQSFVGHSLTELAKNRVVKEEPSQEDVKPPRVKEEKKKEKLPRRRINKTPIVVIPPANMTGSLINMCNVTELLQEMSFCPPDQKRGPQPKSTQTQTTIQRQREGNTVLYKIVENPVKLTPEEWGRIIAVFVMGPTWQFKGWKWHGNPVEIFAHIPAFHIHYDDLQVDKNIRGMSVNMIPISRDKRHLDRARLAKFWDIVDRHLAKQDDKDIRC